MMTYEQVELTDKLQHEMHTLVREYYDATEAKQGLPPYNFNWLLYRKLQESGALYVLEARHRGGSLMGFALYIVGDHPHHKGWRIAECDTLAVAYTARGAGIGKRLCKLGMDVLKNDNIHAVAHKFRTCYDTKPLFADLGFTCVEHVYVKEL